MLRALLTAVPCYAVLISAVLCSEAYCLLLEAYCLLYHALLSALHNVLYCALLLAPLSAVPCCAVSLLFTLLSAVMFSA